MKIVSSLLSFVALGLLAYGEPNAEKSVTYRVEQTTSVTEVPAGTKQVKFWISIPDNERYQDLLDFEVLSAPGTWSVVRDPDRGNRFLLLEVNNPTSSTVSAKLAFTLNRRSVFTEIIPDRVGAITDSHRTLYAEELRQNAPHMKGKRHTASIPVVLAPIRTAR